MSSRNIANLLNQTGYIAVLAVGMTLVIVIRHIDLSVGFLSGFLGAVAAIGMTSYHLPWYVVIPLALALGVVAGSITAFLVAQLGIPAFVATLGGWLVYRGLLLLVLAGTGTIIISDETFNAIGNGYIPDIFPPDTGFLPGVHKLTLLLGLVAIVLYIISEINSRRKKQAYNFEVLPTNLFILKLVFVSVLLAGDHLGACRLQWPLLDGRDHVDRRGRLSVHDDPDGARPAYLRRSVAIQRRPS